MMRKIAWATIVGCASLVLAACGGGGSEQSTSGTLTIGVTYSATGSNAVVGEESLKMLKFAADMVNSGSDLIPPELRGSGKGIDGKTVKFITQDDAGDPTRAIAAVQKLISEGADIVFLDSSSATALQGRVACQQQKVLCIAPTNGNAAIVKQPNADYVFTISPDSQMTANALVLSFRRSGFKTVAYSADDSVVAQQIKDLYKGSIEKAGINTVADEVMPQGASDLTAQVTKLRDAKPDVLVELSVVQQVSGLALKTVADLMPSIPVYTGNSLAAQPSAWSLVGPGLKGAYAVDLVSINNKYTAQVAAAYRSPAGYFTFIDGMNWDAVLLTKYIVEKAKSLDNDKLVAALESVTNFPSAHGSDGYTLNFSKDKHNGASQAGTVLVQYDGTTFVPAPQELQPAGSGQ